MSGAKTCFTCRHAPILTGDEPCASCLREPGAMARWQPTSTPPHPTTGPAAGRDLFAIADMLAAEHSNLDGIRMSRVFPAGLDGCLSVRELAMVSGAEPTKTVYLEGRAEPYVIESASHRFPSGLIVEAQGSRPATERDAALPARSLHTAMKPITEAQVRAVLAPPCPRCQSDPAVGGGLCAGCAATVER